MSCTGSRLVGGSDLLHERTETLGLAKVIEVSVSTSIKAGYRGVQKTLYIHASYTSTHTHTHAHTHTDTRTRTHPISTLRWCRCLPTSPSSAWTCRRACTLTPRRACGPYAASWRTAGTSTGGPGNLCGKFGLQPCAASCWAKYRWGGVLLAFAGWLGLQDGQDGPVPGNAGNRAAARSPGLHTCVMAHVQRGASCM